VKAVGSGPGRFATALETAKELLIKAENVVDDVTDTIDDIGRAVLAGPACWSPGGHGSAHARSKPQYPATTRKTRTGRNEAPRSPY